MDTKARKNMQYAVIYVGAPYGDLEGGHIVSQHKTGRAAKLMMFRRGCCNHIIAKLDDPYPRGLRGETAREYFN